MSDPSCACTDVVLRSKPTANPARAITVSASTHSISVRLLWNTSPPAHRDTRTHA